MERTRPVTRSLFIRELEDGPRVAQIFTTMACGEEAGDGDCGLPWLSKKIVTTLAIGEEAGW